jgi:asparagine synthase (glutamine-hydrolysing)
MNGIDRPIERPEASNVIRLKLDSPFRRWTCSRFLDAAAATFASFWVEGYAWRDGELLFSERLAAAASASLATRDDGSDWLRTFADFVASLNGSWTIVARKGHMILAAVDRVRTWPLFYGVRAGQPMLSDDAREIRRFTGETAADDIAVSEYLLTGFVTGRETIFSGIKQLQAGEALAISTVAGQFQFANVRYYRFYPRPRKSVETDSQLAEALADVCGRVITRLIESCRGRQIVVSLSGGRDSRLVVALLKRLGYDDLLAYSYGPLHSPEVELGRFVAETLKVCWHGISHTRGQLRRCFRTPQRREFYAHAFNFTSQPDHDAWPAVLDLKRSGRIREDAILLTGDSGDMIAGSHLPVPFLSLKSVSEERILAWMLLKHYYNWRWPGLGLLVDSQDGTASASAIGHSDSGENLTSLLIGRIRKHVDVALPCDPYEASSTVECFDWQERQSKFIVNAHARVQEYWGHESRFPLWDAEIVDFLASLPPRLRVGQSLYNACIERHFFTPLGVNQYLSAVDMARMQSRIGSWLRPSLAAFTMPQYGKCWWYNRLRFGWPTRSVTELLKSILWLGKTGQNHVSSYVALEEALEEVDR